MNKFVIKEGAYMIPNELVVAKIERFFNPTLDEALEDMSTFKTLNAKHAGLQSANVVRRYLQNKQKVLSFVKEEKRKEFIVQYSQVFEKVCIESDKVVRSQLLNWEHAASIMMLLNSRTDWNKVTQTLSSQKHDSQTLKDLTSNIVRFSPYGLDFVEHFFGPKERHRFEKLTSSI